MFSKKRILIVGLGNPGLEYEKSRHNTGFCALDRLEKQLQNARPKAKFEGDMYFGRLFDKDVILLKPQTYMNHSGRSVAAAARFYKISPQDIYVIFDDISLPPGKLRIRTRGSAGGHNGVKDIIEDLGSDEFYHIKIGVGAKPCPEYDLADWVLGAPDAEDREKIEKTLDKMPALFRSLFSENLETTLNRFNR